MKSFEMDLRAQFFLLFSFIFSHFSFVVSRCAQFFPQKFFFLPYNAWKEAKVFFFKSVANILLQEKAVMLIAGRRSYNRSSRFDDVIEASRSAEPDQAARSSCDLTRWRLLARRPCFTRLAAFFCTIFMPLDRSVIAHRCRQKHNQAILKFDRPSDVPWLRSFWILCRSAVVNK